MNVSARPAVEADRADVDRLFALATDELREERGAEVWFRHTSRQQGLVWSDHDFDDDLVLAGVIDGAVVGYAIVRAQVLDDGGRLGWISDLYVEPEARDVGVGETLLDAAIAFCRERGCFGIDSVALPGMRGSKNFFEAAGMVARAIVVHKRL